VTAVWTWEGSGTFGADGSAVRVWGSAAAWVTETGETAVIRLTHLVTTTGLGARYVPTGLAWESRIGDDKTVSWVPVTGTA
jgi:hypothetical protein